MGARGERAAAALLAGWLDALVVGAQFVVRPALHRPVPQSWRSRVFPFLPPSTAFNRFILGQTKLGVARYAAFAALHKAGAADGRNMLVPTYDMDLAWHAHMLATFEYDQLLGGQGTGDSSGRLFNHDDSLVDRTQGCVATAAELKASPASLPWRHVHTVLTPLPHARSGRLDRGYSYVRELWQACGLHTLRDGFLGPRLGHLELNAGVLFKGMAPASGPCALPSVFHTHPPAPTRPFAPSWACPRPGHAPAFT